MGDTWIYQDVSTLIPSGGKDDLSFILAFEEQIYIKK
jgi:hypothetical protein